MSRPKSPVAVEDVETHESFIFQLDQEVEFDTMMNEEEEKFWLMNEAYLDIPVPKQSITSRTDLVPSSVVYIRQIQNKESRKLLRCLFDSGASHSLINQRALPENCTVYTLPQTEATQTIAGTFHSTKTVRLRDIHLPEFDPTRQMCF